MLTYGQLLAENTSLRALVAAQEKVIAEQRVQMAQLQSRLEEVEALGAQQAAVIKHQAAEIERLKRRGKRQAASGKRQVGPVGEVPGQEAGVPIGSQEAVEVIRTRRSVDVAEVAGRDALWIEDVFEQDVVDEEELLRTEPFQLGHQALGVHRQEVVVGRNRPRAPWFMLRSAIRQLLV